MYHPQQHIYNEQTYIVYLLTNLDVPPTDSQFYPPSNNHLTRDSPPAQDLPHRLHCVHYKAYFKTIPRDLNIERVQVHTCQHTTGRNSG